MPLAVIPTPIGNLEDITLRALRYLREADLVACEDTRRTGRLLAHYGIKQNLVAYHEHNEERLAPELAERAKTERVALVTDAGTPLVSDPGYRLARACIEAGVEIEALPGPSALTTALVVSGLPADTVVFTGFPPRKGRERTRLLERITTEPSTFVLLVRGGAGKADENIDDVVALARTYVSNGESPSRAAAKAARESGLRRGEVYERLVEG